MLRWLVRCRFGNSIRDRIKQERQTRLGKASESVLPTKTADNISLIRNIGIIAHIDAGKTTTTERMLYYAGALPSPGNIDEGTTTMDYLKQERDRGITIRSAAISFNWNKNQINLIDTPGHVDFSGEVARSLRVLDGAVAILDGVKGVESQTIKVWDQASKHGIPKLCFINKMDRIGSSVTRTSEAIEHFLKVEPLHLQIPVGQGENFIGVVDLISMKQFTFGGMYGDQVKATEVKDGHPIYNEAIKKRVELIERIANYDDITGELFLQDQPIASTILKAAVRRILNNPTIHTKICPILMGSAFKNKGVQPLLDAVASYLPSPSERPPIVSNVDPTVKRQPIKTQRFSGYTFKVVCDKEYGPLSYSRVYSGSIKKNSAIFNSSREVGEKVGNIYRVRANQYVSVTEATAGDIVAIGGLQQTRAGQTLTQVGDTDFVLDKLQLPSAIFTMPIELESKSKEKEFRDAVQKHLLEDNSLEVKEQVETGQFLISGLGQLHLEVFKDKLIEDGIGVKLGNLRIGYRETMGNQVRKEGKQRKDYPNGNYDEFELQIQIAPKRGDDLTIEEGVNVVFTFDKVEGFDTNWSNFLARKQVSKTGRKEESDSKDLQGRSPVKKSTRNPTPIEPMEEEYDEEEGEDQQNEDKSEEEPYYHINTLPFDTLYELTQTCKVAMLSGSNGYPLMGVELRVVSGRFQKKHFSKAIMNRTASTLVRQVLESSVAVEPMLEFTVEGEQSMIDILTSDVLKRRGRVTEQDPKSASGIIPAASVRGWIKQLRVMGLEVSMKLHGYEQIMGIDPKKLLADNA